MGRDLFSAPYGFDLGDIYADVHLWHGEQDRNVPSPWAISLRLPSPIARRIPFRMRDTFRLPTINCARF